LPGGKYRKGREQFSVDGWEFCKQKLDEIVNEETSEETRSVAKKMNATEAEG
jgi:hypothetical protein